MKPIITILFALPLAACAGGIGSGAGNGLFGGGNAGPEPVVETPEIIETQTALGSGEAPTEEGDGAFIGFTVASLGDASIPGLWLETPLVTEEQPGRVVAEDGTVVLVTLRPSGGERGSGSRMSLAAYQALGLSLTALPTVTVISDA